MRQESSADNDADKLTNRQLDRIEADMRVAIDSGYGLNNLNVPIQLQNLFNDLNAEQREKLAAEEDLLRLANMAEEKSGRNKDNDMAEAMYDAVSQQWLKSRHEFAGMNMTGAEWRHVSEYTRQNRQRILQEWMEDGLTQEEAETGLKAIDIMGRGGPKNEAEKDIMRKADQNDDLRSHMQNVAKESGLEPKTQAPAVLNSSTPQQNGITPAQAPDYAV